MTQLLTSNAVRALVTRHAKWPLHLAGRMTITHARLVIRKCVGSTTHGGIFVVRGAAITSIGMDLAITFAMQRRAVVHWLNVGNMTNSFATMMIVIRVSRSLIALTVTNTITDNGA